MAIEVKFCTGKRTHVPVGCAKFDVNRCSESRLRDEKPDFWPVSKFNTGSLQLRGNPAGKKVLYRCTSTFSALNYCSGLFLKSLSYLYEVVRTNCSADFGIFRNF